MRRILIVLSLMIALVGCGVKKTEIVRLTTEELKEKLAGSNADSFNQEVGSVYEIFPISFADSNQDTFGDIQGIISKLDYLNDGDESTQEDLGIDAIWLTPIYPSESYHKYDVLDYKNIDPKFGTLEEFKDLVKEADKRGIKIILDMVFNHSAYNHPWFQSAIKGEAPYTEYYRLEKELPKEQYANRSSWYQVNGIQYYGSFWERMPEFNVESQLVREEFKSVLSFWLDLGVSGFRYDAAKHMYDQYEYPSGFPLLDRTLQFWLEMKQFVKEQNPNAYLVAEVWLDTPVLQPYTVAFDSLFDFDFGASIIGAVQAGSKQKVVESYVKNMKSKTTRNSSFLNATFLSNHDQNRVMTTLSNDVGKAKLAATIMLTMPGIPYLYYGEELGMQGKKPDEQIREPMKWSEDLTKGVATWEPWLYNVDTPSVEVQLLDKNSMLSTYRTLLHLRKQFPALRSESMEEVNLKNSSLMAYRRGSGEDTLVVIHNMYSSDMVFEVEVGELIHQSGDAKISRIANSTMAEITLSGRSTLIFKNNK